MKRYIKSTVLPLKEESYGVKKDIINDLTTSVDALLNLLDDNDPVISNALSIRLGHIAMESNNDTDLMEIIDTQHFALCYEISRNHNASAEVLSYLFNTPICQPDNPKLDPLENGLIPYCIAENPNTSIELLQQLATICSADEHLDSTFWSQVRQKAKDSLNKRGHDL